jgi:RNA polymerase sigma-70 factor (sigma-E family)
MNALDDGEFRGFVAARGPALLRTAYLLTGDQQLAEDLVQSALEKAVRHWSSIRVAAATEAYVRRIMYRDMASFWRRPRVVELPEDAGPEPRPAGSDDTTIEDRLVMRQALMQVTKRQRAVLVLRYYEDLTEQQVAEVLGVSLGTVKSTAHRALAQLRERCGEFSSAMGSESR